MASSRSPAPWLPVNARCWPSGPPRCTPPGGGRPFDQVATVAVRHQQVGLLIGPRSVQATRDPSGDHVGWVRSTSGSGPARVTGSDPSGLIVMISLSVPSTRRRPGSVFDDGDFGGDGSSVGKGARSSSPWRCRRRGGRREWPSAQEGLDRAEWSLHELYEPPCPAFQASTWRCTEAESNQVFS